MKFKNITVLFITILFISSILIACAKEFSIEGVWDVIDDKGNAGSIDFKDNGTFIMSSGVFEIGGSYSFEGEQLELIYKKEDPKNYEVEITNTKSIKLYSIDEKGNRTNEETISMAKSE